MGKELNQWHPALYASMQIEFGEEREKLIFENEHQITKKPLAIDVLVIKKEKDAKIKKNIGRIFREYNIIEYKSPTDYLSIDDFYKVYAYACLYKADTDKTGSIRGDELTITLICNHYPNKMLKVLREERGIRAVSQEKGIYYLEGDCIPVQLIIVKELSKEENLWLNCLRDDLQSGGEIENLLKKYEKKKNIDLYQAVMEVVVSANEEAVKEEKVMCEALKRVFAEEFKESEERGIETGIQRGIEAGIEAGIHEGEQRVNRLIKLLIANSRSDEIGKAAEDPEYQRKLFEEFHII